MSSDYHYFNHFFQSWSRAALGPRRPCTNATSLPPVDIRSCDLQGNPTCEDISQSLVLHHLACGKDYTGDSSAFVGSNGKLSFPTPKVKVYSGPLKIMVYCCDRRLANRFGKVNIIAYVKLFLLMSVQDLTNSIKTHELNSSKPVKHRSQEVSNWSNMTKNSLIMAGDCIIRDIHRKDYRRFPYNFRAADVVIIMVY